MPAGEESIKIASLLSFFFDFLENVLTHSFTHSLTPNFKIIIIQKTGDRVDPRNSLTRRFPSFSVTDLLLDTVDDDDAISSGLGNIDGIDPGNSFRGIRLGPKLEKEVLTHTEKTLKEGKSRVPAIWFWG